PEAGEFVERNAWQVARRHRRVGEAARLAQPARPDHLQAVAARRQPPPQPPRRLVGLGRGRRPARQARLAGHIGVRFWILDFGFWIVHEWNDLLQGLFLLTRFLPMWLPTLIQYVHTHTERPCHWDYSYSREKYTE